MPREQLTLQFAEKGKDPVRTFSQAAANAAPSTTQPRTQPPLPSLEILKASVENSPGIVKNAKDARELLNKKQWLLSDQEVTYTHLAAILLSLVTTYGPRKTTEKISDTVANDIKAVAYLLEEATIAKYVDNITNRIAANTAQPNDIQANSDTAKHINETLSSINETVNNNTQAIKRTNETLAKMQETLASHATTTTQPLSYRDALINGKLPATRATTLQEARIQNRLNISACQILIEVQIPDTDTTAEALWNDANPMGTIKANMNQWIDSHNGEDPPPKKAFIRALTTFRNKKLLIETDSAETTEWMKRNCGEFLKSALGHPTKVLGRLYPVIARFMPISFNTNEDGARDLENSAKLPADSISHVTWIKKIENRSATQQYANVKIFCTSAEAANKLLLAAGKFRHLGSYLRIHKDIREPCACNHCQRYGHFAKECIEDTPKCAKCAGEHITSKCTSTVFKCTPCNSNEHHTNSDKCPERKARETARLNKNPEAASPFYITEEPWTWGHLPPPNSQHDNENNNTDTPTPRVRFPPRNTTRNTRAPAPTYTRNPSSSFFNNRGTFGQQRTPTFASSQHRQQQQRTGSNTTPLGPTNPKTTNPNTNPPPNASPNHTQTNPPNNPQ